MRTKIMRPHDIRPYCNINPQAIREGMKAGKLDIGFAVQQNGGQRWTYVIIPEKFFHLQITSISGKMKADTTHSVISAFKNV